jgi:hypothetical protein
MGFRIPGSAVSAVAGAVEREASLALRAVQQSWSAAPKRAPVRSAMSSTKDWSVPILLGGAGLTYLSSPSGDSSIFSSLFGPSAPTSPPSNAPITARRSDAPNTAADTGITTNTDAARVSAMLSDISTRRFSGVEVDRGQASMEYTLPLPMSLQKLSPTQQKAVATRPLNYFDKFDNETEYWSGKPEDLPANFDERFSAAQ